MNMDSGHLVSQCSGARIGGGGSRQHQLHPILIKLASLED